ncbi:syntaxin-6 [Ostrinia furnacalis]|uniref:syntaxin-6 n=1 Tax=Ostrinia furnacalis TaxID=93504 RepID=UPI00103B6A47|nr:syntaxin-6 [Ostrinia furnacalis]
MTLEDPFYVVKDEVFKALNKTRGLYLRWQEISKAPVAPTSPEVEWTSTELRNALRSIEWDLEDLEDTISIVEKNSSKFKIDNKEICDRRTFIEATKQEVKVMKTKMSLNRNRDSDGTAREPLLGDESPPPFAGSWTSTPKYSQYSKLASQDSPRLELLAAQRRMLGAQDDQLQVISHSVGSLKTLSKQIGSELDDQAVMLDDLNTELENADSKLDSTIKKVAKVLHMNNDRRQWLAILILIGLLVVILILFVII